ncbi:hypothetical protein CK934_17985 [Chitinophaga sp. MD30]|nr:hypothetical protein CK934_17985 [Chitinophaga sp. MD30]
MVFVICLLSVSRVRLGSQTTSETHAHFAVDAGYKAFNFQIVQAQFDFVCIVLFHKIVFN